MAKHDEISSTEQLLELIRKEKNASQASSSRNASTSNKPPSLRSASLFSALSFAKKITIGVDIGYTELKLSKIHQQSDKKYTLLDYISIPISPGITIESDAFADFLKYAMTRFCGRLKSSMEIWSAISSARVDTRCIRIPKLPRKQIPNAVFWTFTKEVPFNEAEEVLDFEILGETLENGVQKIEVMAYTAPKKDLERYRNLFKIAGFPLTGISIIPFAIQNLLRTEIITPGDKNICNLYIGRDWSRIAIYSEGNLILSRGIRAGMRSMIAEIRENNGIGEDDAGNAFSENSHDENAEPPRRTETTQDNETKQLFFRFVRDHSNLDDAIYPEGYDKQALFRIMMPALERLVRQVERTFEHYRLKFSAEGISKLYLSGQMCGNELIGSYFRRQLEIPVAVLDPFPVDSHFTRSVAIPQTTVEKESFVPSLGMGLSSNTITPNFIYTHKDKEKEESINRTNFVVFIICLTIVTILSAIYLWQGYSIREKQDRMAELKQESLMQKSPADKDMILQFFTRANQNNQQIKALSEKYLPVAVISEISEFTPSMIRVVSMKGEFTADENENSVLTIDGVIFGNRLNFDATLTAYLFRLKNSPLFDRPTITKKGFEFYENEEVLRFTAQLDII